MDKHLHSWQNLKIVFAVVMGNGRMSLFRWPSHPTEWTNNSSHWISKRLSAELARRYSQIISFKQAILCSELTHVNALKRQ